MLNPFPFTHRRFGDIMQSKGGFAFVNWDNFNTYKEIECDDDAEDE